MSHSGNKGTQTLYFEGDIEISLQSHCALMTFTVILPMLAEYALAMDGKMKLVDIGVIHWNPNLHDDDSYAISTTS